MFIDAAVSYSAHAFAMLTRGLAAHHGRLATGGLPDLVIRDLGLRQGPVAPVVRGMRFR